MLSNEMGKQICSHVSDYVLFDLETTGVSSIHDEVIEISAVKVRDGKVVDEFSELVNPGRPIPFEASMVNNITDKMVAGAPFFDEVLTRFLDFIGDDVLVGHNINSFDLKFIYRDCEKYFGKTLANDYVDTLKFAKIVFPDWKHRRLSDLAEHYNISTKDAHRALADCKMNQQVFEFMAADLKRMMEGSAGKGKDGASGKAGGSVPGLKGCPRCGMPMTKRSGRYGEFWGCMGYPVCKHTENI